MHRDADPAMLVHRRTPQVLRDDQYLRRLEVRGLLQVVNLDIARVPVVWVVFKDDNPASGAFLDELTAVNAPMSPVR
jgi:hypothetical protein